MGGWPQRSTGGARASRDPSHPPNAAQLLGRTRDVANPGGGGPWATHSEDEDLRPAPPVLLLGVGNILYGDEGLGVYVVHRIRRMYIIPPGLRIIDGGALGWHVAPYLEQASRAVIVDAVAAPVGSIFRYTHATVPDGVRHSKLSSEELQLPTLLATLEERGKLPPTRIVAMGVAPAQRGADTLGVGLSPVIEARLPALELLLLAELSDAGIQLKPRSRLAVTPQPQAGVRPAGRRRV